MMGLMPDLDIIAMLASKMSSNKVIGWLAHFMIGSIGYSILMALIAGTDSNANATSYLWCGIR